MLVLKMQRLVIFLIIAQACIQTNAQDKPTFPKMNEIFVDFYQTEVQMTDADQDGTAFATEYYDDSQNRGRVDVVVLGEKLSLFYNNITGDISRVNSTSCEVWEKDLSDYYYMDLFFGWLSREPLIIGPSALLWLGQQLKPEHEGQETVRGIDCDKFEASYDSERENMDYKFYFAVKDWTTPYKYSNLRVPIRIVVTGVTSRLSEDKKDFVPIDQMVDFAYFKPTLDDNKMYPEVGLGCYRRTPEFIMPKLPKEFKYAAEIYDLMKAENSADSEATFGRMWFSTYNQLGRLDIYKKESMSSNLYDFKNGVIYSIENRQTCNIKALRNSMFEAEDNLMGYLKTPEQVLGLNGDFYYMGHSTERGINCRIFESAQRDIYYNDDHYHLLVTTVYFTEPYTKGIVGGADMTNFPVKILITGYDLPNHVSVKLQISIFGFNAEVGQTIFDGFSIQDCFPLPNQRAYFVLEADVDDKTAQTLEGNDELFIEELTSSIMMATNVSVVRLPFLKADYTSSGVYVSGLMLDRPPMLLQFWQFSYGPSKADGLKKIQKKVDKEQCAFACIDEKDFTCLGFHYCNNECYINKKSPWDEPIEADTLDLGICEVYLRAEINSTTKDPYLADALQKLVNSNLTVDVPMESGDTFEVKFPSITIGDGAYNKNINQKSYNTLYSAFQLLPPSTMETSVDVPGISTENDCYAACKTDTTIDCQTFSYCPDADNKMCRISSVLMMKGSPNNMEMLENNRMCNVYSLLNLDYFTAYPGKVMMVTGDKSLKTVSVEECAVSCKKESKFSCRGFEFCNKENACVLHSKHIYDLKPGQVVDSNQKCTHYAAKYIADYLDMGSTLIDDWDNKRTDITLEECARVCSEESTECSSFNYCPSTSPLNTDATCAMTTKNLASPNVKTTTKERCRLYTKRDDVESYGTKRRTLTITNSGYSSKGFAGMVVGTLIFGLFIGILAFVGYSFYRSRNSGDGMSVRFMKQTDS